MCGITGWFDLSGERPADRAIIRKMTDSIAHRGPDGEGFHFAPGIALGHRRLAIIDLNTGDQPMFNRSKSVAIVFNGEIYNFRDLRQDLQTRGYRFDTSSDTEVIIRAWEEWRENCVDHLSGMFAFAIWDQAMRTLFLARDRLGEKPLYYSFLADGSLIFGSELKALLVHPALARGIDPCAVEEFFALGYIAEPRTVYANVQKLSAGACMTVRRHEAPRLRNYWQPKTIPSQNRNIRGVADELVDRLASCVKAQLVADVPVGAFLSGGVDSSGTAALMAKCTGSPIRCFTIGFNDAQFDETGHAAAVARRYSMDHVIAHMTGSESGLVTTLARIFDEPFGDSSALPSCFLMQLARKDVKVALSGDAGDELFAGYRRYLFHSREERLRQIFPAWLRQSLFGPLSRVYPQLDWAPRYFRARHTFRELSVESAEGYFWNLSVTDDDTRAALFSPKLDSELQGYKASEVVRRYWADAPDDDPVTVAQYVDLKTWLPGDILTKVDRTAMACGLEVRVPMLDHRFVEWALSLPHALKIAKGEGKFVLKRAFERLVPREVLYRPKQGFSVPLAAWFRGPLGEAFRRDLTRNEGIADCAFFRTTTIDGLIEQHRGGLHDHSRVLWLLWMFHRFLTDVHTRSSAGAVPASV